MKSKVEVNRDGINYLVKGEEPKVLKKENKETELQVTRNNKCVNFKVANDVMKLWFE